MFEPLKRFLNANLAHDQIFFPTIPKGVGSVPFHEENQNQAPIVSPSVIRVRTLRQSCGDMEFNFYTEYMGMSFKLTQHNNEESRMG